MELWEQRADEAGLNVVDSVIAKDYPDDDAAAECMRLGRAAGITQRRLDHLQSAGLAAISISRRVSYRCIT